MVVLKLERYDNTDCSWSTLTVYKSKNILCFCNLLGTEVYDNVFGVHTDSNLKSNQKYGFINDKGILK